MRNTSNTDLWPKHSHVSTQLLIKHARSPVYIKIGLGRNPFRRGLYFFIYQVLSSHTLFYFHKNKLPKSIGNFHQTLILCDSKLIYVHIFQNKSKNFTSYTPNQPLTNQPTSHKTMTQLKHNYRNLQSVSSKIGSLQELSTNILNTILVYLTLSAFGMILQQENKEILK